MVDGFAMASPFVAYEVLKRKNSKSKTKKLLRSGGCECLFIVFSLLVSSDL